MDAFNSPITAWAMAGLLLGAAGAPLHAQEAAQPSSELEEVVITATGTSIRGIAPVGANLITVDHQAIVESGAQTVQQILDTVPAITGFGNAAQGGFGSADASGTYAPTIHGEGASASNGTLVLIDGARLPQSGVNHVLADPNIIAPLAIERVEVLPDGASATYGSDAVAGVINFITRQNFKGFETTAQYGLGDEYNTESAGFLWGDTWENSSVMVSYDYERRSALSNADRSFTAANHTAEGGFNFGSYNCGQANAKVAGQYYAFPYTGAPITTGPPCDYSGDADTLPEDSRNSLLVKITHQVNDRLSFNGDVIYSDEENTARVSRGTVTATVYGPGATLPVGSEASINPYFQGPPGVTSEQVYWDANNLLGPGAEAQGGAKSFMVKMGAEYKLGGDWLGSLGVNLGQNQSTLLTVGTVCVSCAYADLNGTYAGGGTGTGVQTLTTANALDVWNPTGSNLTPASVLAALTNSDSWQQTNNVIRDATLKFDGSLFSLPGGDVKAAVGGEYIDYTITEQVVRSNNDGPSTVSSQAFDLDWGRNVHSGFAELYLPLVGDGNAVPFVQKLALQLAGRYDDYSDFGSTTNPKFALTWEMAKSVSLRANYGKSFTAPALTSIGKNGVTAESGYASAGAGFSGPLVLPATYPGVAALEAQGLAGCAVGSPTCTINSTSVTGVSLTGPNQNLKPERGTSWSVGLDITPTAVPGLKLSGTLWNVEYQGMITSPLAAFAISSPALSPLLTIYPDGLTPAQVAGYTGGRPQTGALPPLTYFIYSYQQQNALNLKTEGVDFDALYKFSTPAGQFSADLAGSIKIKEMQQFGSGGQWFSILNTSGFNTTFPSNEIGMRLDLGWRDLGWSADFITNYEGSYLNWNGNAPYGLVRDSAFSPVGGGQGIPAYYTFDLHLGYKVSDSGALANTQVELVGTNITNKAPPFYNTALGYDSFNANPIGRVVTLDITKKW